MVSSVEVTKVSATAAYLANKTVAEPLLHLRENVPGLLT